MCPCGKAPVSAQSIKTGVKVLTLLSLSPSESWNNNRDLLRRLEQERRRKQVEEKYIPSEKTPVFPKPYKTNEEGELSRRVKQLLGEWDSSLIPWQEPSPSPLWFPEKSKSESQTCSSGLVSRKTNPNEDIRKEFSLQSLDLKPDTEQNSNVCNEVVSKQRSEAKALPSKILPEPVKKKKPIGVPSTEKALKVVEKPPPSLAPPRAVQSQQKTVAPAQPSSCESGSSKDCHSSTASAPPRAPTQKEMSSTLSSLLPPLQSLARTETSKPPLEAKEINTELDEPSIEEILREMSSSLPPLLSPLQTPTKAESSKLPLATKESQPDESAAQKQEQAGAASETSQSSETRTSSSESGSSSNSRSSPGCDRDVSSSDSEDKPAPKPEPPAYNKWWLGNLMAQAKQRAAPGQGLREIVHGNGCEEGEKQEQGTNSNSYQQHSKARETPHETDGQVAKKSQQTCQQITKDFQKSSGQAVKNSQKTCNQFAKHFHKSSGKVAKKSQQTSQQVAKGSQESSGTLAKTSPKSSGQRAKDFQQSSGQVTEDSHKSSGQVTKDSHESSGQITKDFQKSSGQAVKNSQMTWSQFAERYRKTFGQVAKKSQQTSQQVAKGSQESSGTLAKTSPKSSGQRAKDLHESPGQVTKDSHESSGQITKDFHKNPGQVTEDLQKSSGQAVKDSLKSWNQFAERFRKSSGKVAKEFHTSSVQSAKVSEKSFGQGPETSHKSCGQVAKGPQKSWGQVAKNGHKSSGSLGKDSQKSSVQVDQAPLQAYLQTEQSCLEPPRLTKEPLPKECVGTKRHGEPLEHDKSKRVRKGESEPGPGEVTDQSCKDQLRVKEKPKIDTEDPKLALLELSEEREHKGSPQSNSKGFLGPELLGDAQEGDAFIPNGHSTGDLHKEKVPSPPGEKKLFLPARKPDLKRKEMTSPEEPPRKKKIGLSMLEAASAESSSAGGGGASEASFQAEMKNVVLATTAGHDCCTMCIKLDPKETQN
ncbi:hypothetical protein Nmel_006703 [Mimus melanotis]